ncbi:MAG: M56 family metallopeptidase [Pirellulaceae bacterium]
MNELLLLIAQNAVLLSVGTTLLLSLGSVAVWFCKSPVHRQRISELTIAGVLAWIVLALFPLPRLLPDWFSRDLQPAVESKDATPDSENATEPDGLYSESTVPAIKIPTNGPELMPDVTDAVGDDEVVEDAERVAGDKMPLHIPSPLEELSAFHAEVNPPTAIVEASAIAPSPWRFEFQKLSGLCTGAYLAGAFLSLLWIVAGHLLLLRIRQTAEAPPQWLAIEFQSLAGQAGVVPPRLIVSRLCARPITWGVFWPVVVLPHSLCRQENKSQLRTILLHEQGHVAQQDSQGNLLFCVALPLLYFHPLYWWLRRDSQLAAELVADDWAGWQTGKETYVEELVALARCTGTSSLPLVGVTGLFSSPSQFYRRMQMLLAREKPLSTRTSLPWRLASLSALAGAVALAASLAGVRPAAGQTEPPVAETPITKPSVVEPTAPRTTDAPQPVLNDQPENVPMSLPPPKRAADARPTERGPEPLDPSARALPDSAPPTNTRDEEADLTAEINQLQKKLHEKLRSLEANRSVGNKPAADVINAPTPPLDGQVKIIRADEKGFLIVETWTTDKEGRPNKMVTRRVAESPRPAPAGDELTVDRKILARPYMNPDGSQAIEFLDAATGKVIAQRRATTPKSREEEEFLSADTQSNAREVMVPLVGRVMFPPGTKARPPIGLPGPSRVEYPIPRVTGETEVPLANQQPLYADDATATTYRPIANSPNPILSKGGHQLDLIALATSYADAVSVLEAAEAKAGDIERRGDSKAISQQEVTSAKLALSAAKRKENLLRSIVQVATESASQELNRLNKSPGTSTSAVEEAETRLVILKQILATRSSVERDSKTP